MRNESIYLPPNDWLEFSSDSFKVNLINEVLDKVLPLARDFERFFTL